MQQALQTLPEMGLKQIPQATPRQVTQHKTAPRIIKRHRIRRAPITIRREIKRQIVQQATKQVRTLLKTPHQAI